MKKHKKQGGGPRSKLYRIFTHHTSIRYEKNERWCVVRRVHNTLGNQIPSTVRYKTNNGDNHHTQA